VRPDVVVPPLDPAVPLDCALVPYATEAAAGLWGDWWESLLDRHPEVDGVPPLLRDTLPLLPEPLRPLLAAGLDAANAWYAEREREDFDERRFGDRFGAALPIGGIVREIERELGRPAAPFNLLISIVPVKGVWGRRVRFDHVMISKALCREAGGFAAFIEPVVRELAE
jgi:hypothetical protein